MAIAISWRAGHLTDFRIGNDVINVVPCLKFCAGGKCISSTNAKIKSHRFRHHVMPSLRLPQAAFSRFRKLPVTVPGNPYQYRVIAGSNMPTTPDWRNAAAYSYLQELNRAELAWEFLRRNPNYNRDFRTAGRRTSDQTDFPERLARHWGLRFPCRSGAARRQGAAGLVAAL
jgi:hypothetical protein